MLKKKKFDFPDLNDCVSSSSLFDAVTVMVMTTILNLAGTLGLLCFDEPMVISVMLMIQVTMVVLLVKIVLRMVRKIAKLVCY